MSPKDWQACCIVGMAGPIGVVFDCRQPLVERLCFPPEPSGEKEGTVAKSRWTLSRIADRFDFFKGKSLSGVWYALRRCGIRLRHGRPQMYRPDGASRQKVERLLAALRDARQSPRQIVVLFLDEMSYESWPQAACDWGEQAPAPPPLAKRKPARFRRRRIIGALNATTGRVYYHDAPHISGPVAAFLKLLARAYRWARTIYIVWDNWPVHHSEPVLLALAQHPRLQVISLPTYAPWLNPIEKLWRKFRQELDYLHRLADAWESFQQRVHQFFDQFAARSPSLLRYVGLSGNGLLASALHDP